MTGGWRKLHNEELRKPFSAPNIISDEVKEDEMTRIRIRAKGNTCTYRILVGKRGPRIPRRRWEYDIKLDLTEAGWSVLGWMDLAAGRDQRELGSEFSVPEFLNTRTIGGF
jgi:hypothetical protein